MLPSLPATRRRNAHRLLLSAPRAPGTALESPTTRIRAAATAASIALFATSSPLGSPLVIAARTPEPPLLAPPSRILSAAEGPAVNNAPTRPSALLMLPDTIPISAAMAFPAPLSALPSMSLWYVALNPTGAAMPTSARPQLPDTPRTSAAVSPIQTHPAPENLPPSTVEISAASTATPALPVRITSHCCVYVFTFFVLDLYKVSIQLNKSLIDFYFCNIEHAESAGHNPKSCVKDPGTTTSSEPGVMSDTTSAASCKAAASAGAAAALAAAAANFA